MEQTHGWANGIPSHDTFGRVFSAPDAERFQECFTEWVRTVSKITEGQTVAIDGKTVRRSHDYRAGRSAIHVVSAWASANRLALGQTRVDDKSNEITAIPKLLSMLELSGCIVTIDAKGCQKETASKIIERGADYALSLKRNQSRLHEEVSELFDEAGRERFAFLDCDWFETVEKGHGRVETRRCRSVSGAAFIGYLNDRGEWPKLRSVAMVESERYVDGKTSIGNLCITIVIPAKAEIQGWVAGCFTSETSGLSTSPPY